MNTPVLIPTIKVQMKKYDNVEGVINACDFNPEEHKHVGEVQSDATKIKVDFDAETEGGGVKVEGNGKGKDRKRLNA